MVTDAIRSPFWQAAFVDAQRKQRKKKQTQHDIEQHAILRARQRYGVHISVADLHSLASRLQRGCGTVLCRQDTCRSVCEIDGYAVIYDRRKRVIRTFLPPRTTTAAEYLEQLRRYWEWD